VTGIHLVPPEFVTAQIRRGVHRSRWSARSRLEMVAQLATIEAIAAGAWRACAPAHVVLDPVMVATSGDRLLSADAGRGAAHKAHSRRASIPDAEPPRGRGPSR